MGREGGHPPIGPTRRPRPTGPSRVPIVAAFAVSLPLLGFTKAQMELPAGFDAVEAHPVTGHNPSAWKRPISFGPWHTVTVDDGTSKSWSVEAFGLGAGATRHRYHLVLEGRDGTRREVVCLTRGLELWRGSFTIDLSGVATRRLACVIRAGEDSSTVSLLLGQDGNKLRGSLQVDGAVFEIASIHRFKGSRIASPEPVGYTISRDGATAVAVETVNRGRVWFAPDAAHPTDLAAAASALLLFDPEASQR